MRRQSSTVTTPNTSAQQTPNSPPNSNGVIVEDMNEKNTKVENAFTLLVSTAVQTDWIDLIDDEDFMPDVELGHNEDQNNDSLDDILASEMDFEVSFVLSISLITYHSLKVIKIAGSTLFLFLFCLNC